MNKEKKLLLGTIFGVGLIAATTFGTIKLLSSQEGVSSSFPKTEKKLSPTPQPFSFSFELSLEELQNRDIDRVYFSQTGHHLEGNFLTFWKTFKKPDTRLGLPITEPQVSDGKTVQYFENVRIDQDESGTHIGPLVREYAEKIGFELKESPKVLPSMEWFCKDMGDDFCGEPISDATEDEDGTVQYFENVRLVLLPPRQEPHSTRILPGEVAVFPMARFLAEQEGISTASVFPKEGTLKIRVQREQDMECCEGMGGMHEYP
ncbi:MAG TPA: hypothetical protein VJ179_04080 [Patescibacteria group bacterium]|nr:hypothetical protein [Patescibacteria group bacterium]